MKTNPNQGYGIDPIIRYDFGGIIVLAIILLLSAGIIYYTVKRK